MSRRLRRLRRRLARLGRRYRLPLILLALVCATFLVVSATIALQAVSARSQAQEARTALSAAQQAARDGELEAARAELRKADRAADAARRRTSGALWRGYGRLPVVGPSVREVSGLVDALSRVTSDVLPPLLEATPKGGARWSGRVDLATVDGLSEQLDRSSTAMDQVLGRVEGLPSARVSRVSVLRSDLVAQLRSVRADVREAAALAGTAHALLAGPKGHVLVLGQNNAEERATGGLFGSYAYLATDRGAFRVVREGPNSQFRDAPSGVVSLGAEFQARYGRAGSTSSWLSSNLTPDVPSVGTVVSRLAARQGMPVDGVLFLDAPGVSDLLTATGPVSFDAGGRTLQLSSSNAVRVLLRDLYERYPTKADTLARDRAFTAALRAVVEAVRRPGMPLAPFVRALRQATSTGHLQVFATATDAQRRLLGSPAGGALPRSGPYLSVVTQDVGGSKLSGYLTRSVRYESRPGPFAVDLGAGPEEEERARITVRLKNNAPSRGLPPYVVARADLPGDVSFVPGRMRTWLSIYLGPRSSYSSATLDGQPVRLMTQTEKGLGIFSTFLELNPGESAELVLEASQPAPVGSLLTWRQQPRLQPDELEVVRHGTTATYRSYYAEK